MRLALLAHGRFPDRAKTALGLLRYADDEVAAVIDRESAGDRVADHVAGVQDAPIVAGFEGTPTVDRLVIGVAPIGGDFEESWRPDVAAALRAGCDVVAGLHHFLAEDEEFRALADEHGCELVDVRRPPDDLSVAAGTAADVEATRLLTVGTDCSVGKMTTTFEAARAAGERGTDAAVVPTGQTGIMIAGWGIAVDRTVSDFAAGAVERMVHRAGDRELLLIEGQGSLLHPAYSGVTTAILHGAMPDGLVLCHAAGREAIHGYADTPIPDPSTCADLYESVAAPIHGAPVVAGALNTAAIDDDTEARAAVERFGDAIGAPATDPVRFGVEEVLAAV